MWPNKYRSLYLGLFYFVFSTLHFINSNIYNVLIHESFEFQILSSYECWNPFRDYLHNPFFTHVRVFLPSLMMKFQTYPNNIIKLLRE